MVSCNYISLSGERIEFDLDAVVDVCAAYSQARTGWTATLVYEPTTKAFVELRSSPQDYRGNSQEESVEVASEYIEQAFGVSPLQQAGIKKRPHEWLFINRRVSA